MDDQNITKQDGGDFLYHVKCQRHNDTEYIIDC